jgi:hypothetical protein
VFRSNRVRSYATISTSSVIATDNRVSQEMEITVGDQGHAQVENNFAGGRLRVLPTSFVTPLIKGPVFNGAFGILASAALLATLRDATEASTALSWQLAERQAKEALREVTFDDMTNSVVYSVSRSKGGSSSGTERFANEEPTLGAVPGALGDLFGLEDIITAALPRSEDRFTAQVNGNWGLTVEVGYANDSYTLAGIIFEVAKPHPTTTVQLTGNHAVLLVLCNAYERRVILANQSDAQQPGDSTEISIHNNGFIGW